MNCAYHTHNPAGANCNGCGRPLCPACDHRIKGFPFCQDCIVFGVDLLRKYNQSNNYVSYVKKRTSPVLATLLSAVCPGLGAAYNGQSTKALVYFAVFAGLFQMAVLTSGTPLFVLGFIGMWFFSAIDAWRTAQMIRAGVTPDVAEDILVKRFSGNPKLWGIALTALGVAFVFQRVFSVGFLMRALLPLMLIGLGVYILRGYIFRKPKIDEIRFSGRNADTASASFALTQPNAGGQNYDRDTEFSTRSRFGSWRDR